MATRQARRAANKEGSMYSAFKQIFTDARLAAITLQAVQLVTESPILDQEFEKLTHWQTCMSCAAWRLVVQS